MHIEYNYENMWAHLGRGLLQLDRDPLTTADLSTYINLDRIDPLWWKAVQDSHDGGEQ